ncbi:MAG TPA: hypothetical protein VH081_12555 [Solirubrobacteraceae bacterium]|jgi:hypothetical protein|nr:hypothetical protein [Solirubrobacteraceae bacterium]
MRGAEQAARTDARVTIDQIVLADEPERWRSLGFDVDRDRLQLGSVCLRLAGDSARIGTAPGMLEWSLREIGSTELDGLPTLRSNSPPPAPAPEHPNAVVAIDHVVAMTPALDRSVRVLQDAGLDLRRIREQPTPTGAPRQAFFRLGAEILELVQEPEEALRRDEETDGERPARLWGLALLSSDIERTVAALGEHAGEPREAVQPGRQIVTVKRSAGLAVPLAVMSARS